MNNANDSSNNSSAGSTTHSPSSGRSAALLTVAGLLIAGGFAWQASRASDLEQKISEGNQQRAALQTRLEQTDSAWQSAMKSVQQGLDESRAQNKTLISDSDRLAKRRADAFAKQTAARHQELADALDKVKTEQTAKLDGITTEVGSVRDDMGGVKTDVGTVRADVETTRADLKDARAELIRVKGDLGEMSGLIATNASQIQMLRDLGDRNIYEFTLARDANQKVGDIQLTLKKTDLKRSRFTMVVSADDRHVEKKDRMVNEPVQFYTTKAKQPYEIVVNQVQKDKVVGYLATPKVTLARADSTKSTK
jgi:hypothetical protein